jgi:hypothetical protein
MYTLFVKLRSRLGNSLISISIPAFCVDRKYEDDDNRQKTVVYVISVAKNRYSKTSGCRIYFICKSR